MRTSHRQIRKRILDAKSKITDEEFFSSRAYNGYLTDLAEAATKRYKRPLRVRVVADHDDETVAFTDYHGIYINACNHITWRFPSRLLRSMSLEGLNAHECGHNLFTDERIWHSYFAGLAKGKFYPKMPDGLDSMQKLYAKDILEALTDDTDTVPMQVIMSTAHALSNILEDGYVDARYSYEFPGSPAKGIALNNLRYADTMPEITEMINRKYYDHSIVVNLLIQYVRAHEVNNLSGYTGEFIDKLYEYIPWIDESVYDDAFNKFFFVEEDKIYAFGPNRDRKSKLQTEESKALELVTDYPVKSWYPSFEAYCDEHRGFVKASDGRWGYTCNPNAKWDWWQIGGRFPNRFLVPAGLQDCIPSAKDDDGESATPPEGYQYADAARKKDICWDVMRKIAVDTVEKRYQKCVKAFETKDITDFGPLCRILDEGISVWGEMLYLKGETLDEYKARKGATDLDRYMCHKNKATYPAAVAELYGNKDARNDYFDNLRKSGDDAVLEAVRRERERIMLLGSDPTCQASYIKKLFDNNVACFGASKENGGESFPDYVGALILGELDKCVALSAVYRKKEDEVAKERRTKAEAEERAFCEEQNRLSEQAVQEAIRTIKDGGVLQNQTVKFYRSRYRCNAFSIVNYLMRKYGVNVPLRTQGWINEKLTSVTIENGKCEHLRYMRAKGAQCSQRFFDCMSELIHNVCAETEG